ncbi:hypothetical protein BG74_07375 [Sodalis-like endosymbiont of Proechinophthirus fluctus]|nr:hypothetical protein BG74_07375 [Sodalis-like endosymbiont of Proechinophthirus fluctus]
MTVIAAINTVAYQPGGRSASGIFYPTQLSNRRYSGGPPHGIGLDNGAGRADGNDIGNASAVLFGQRRVNQQWQIYQQFAEEKSRIAFTVDDK